MRFFVTSRIQSFGHAFSGWGYVIRTQKNAWIHALATFLVIGLAIWLKLSRLEWAFILLAIALVWMAECFNTAIEALTNLVSPELHPLAGIAKDTGAAAVLIAALVSAGIGLLILLPPLLNRIR